MKHILAFVSVPSNSPSFVFTVTSSRDSQCVFIAWLTSEKLSTGRLLIRRVLTSSGGLMKAGSLIPDQAWWVTLDHSPEQISPLHFSDALLPINCKSDLSEGIDKERVQPCTKSEWCARGLLWAGVLGAVGRDLHMKWGEMLWWTTHQKCTHKSASSSARLAPINPFEQKNLYNFLKKRRHLNRDC